MNKLEEKIKKIKKEYFCLNDLRKISEMDDNSLIVAVSRMVKDGRLFSLRKNWYAFDVSKVDFAKLALELYQPSYLSFEWALGYHNILSQKSEQVTLATSKMSKTLEVADKVFIYHHLKEDLFWGYEKVDNYLIAAPEKALLDLAYLSIKGYAHFDGEEMNWKYLDKNKIQEYLKKIGNKRLGDLFKKYNHKYA